METIECPRCHKSAEVRFYGPCDICREQLRATQVGQSGEVEVVEYEPKMNVIPNQIATKE